MRKARRRQALTLPIDMSRSSDGFYAYSGVVARFAECYLR